MSLFAKRNISASHARRAIDPDVDATDTPLGTIFLSLPVETQTAQAEEFLTSSTGEFEMQFDPAVDLRQGDILTINSVEHEVVAVRKFQTTKRTDYAECDVVRREVPV